MRKCLLAIAMFLCTALWLGDALAYNVDKRVALVIGNSNYQHAVTLPNPVNDGKLIADTLRKAGFTVIEGADLDKVGMGRRSTSSPKPPTTPTSRSSIMPATGCRSTDATT